MFRLFSFHKKPKRIYSEDELKQRASNDGYRRSKTFHDVLMYTVCILLIFLAVALVVEYVIDLDFRAFILNQIKESFKGIIFFLLSLFGIKINQKNNDNT